MISTTAEYALRTIAYFATRDGEPIAREEICAATQVPFDYLAKVMKSLATAGIVKSRRGPGGGYVLLRDPAKLTAYEVIAAVSELPKHDKCPLGIADHINLCPLHARLNEVSQMAETVFRNTRMSELLPKQADVHGCVFPHPDPAE